MEDNRLISEQSTPAKNRMESRKDTGDKKEKYLQEKEREEIKHAFNSHKGLQHCFWKVSHVCVCVRKWDIAYSRHVGCLHLSSTLSSTL